MTTFISAGDISWGSSRMRCYWPAKYMGATVVTWREVLAGKQIEDDKIIGPGRNRHLRPQHVHLQPLPDPRQDRPRQEHAKRIRFAPEQKVREHAALGGAVGAVGAGVVGQPFDVAAQLAVKEIARFLPREGEHPELWDVHQHAARRGRGDLAGRIAEIADQAVRNRCASRGKESEKSIVHRIDFRRHRAGDRIISAGPRQPPRRP